MADHACRDPGFRCLGGQGAGLPALPFAASRHRASGGACAALPGTETRASFALGSPALLQAGVFTILLGPPGSGKTTFLQTLAGANRRDHSLKARGEPGSGLGWRRGRAVLCCLLLRFPMPPNVCASAAGRLTCLSQQRREVSRPYASVLRLLPPPQPPTPPASFLASPAGAGTGAELQRPAAARVLRGASRCLCVAGEGRGLAWAAQKSFRMRMMPRQRAPPLPHFLPGCAGGGSTYHVSPVPGSCNQKQAH